LARSYKNPTVSDLKEANAIIRLGKRLGPSEFLYFGTKIDLGNCVVIGAGDAAFDNLENSGSQGGKVMMIGTPEILDGKGLGHVATWEWTSNRIKRVVRSTLAAEAYVMGESSEGVEFVRQLLAELYNPLYTIKSREECANAIPAVLVTDARSLFDNLKKDGGTVKDRRLRLELNLIRGLENCMVRWLNSEMMVADELTKTISEESHEYASLVRRTGLWSLHRDTRAPTPRRTRLLTSTDDASQARIGGKSGPQNEEDHDDQKRLKTVLPCGA
jgi:hypothetical protein